MNSITLIPPSDLSKSLGVSVHTLANWRSAGKGPLFVKVGQKVQYRLSDVEAWLDKRTKQAA